MRAFLLPRNKFGSLSIFYQSSFEKLSILLKYFSVCSTYNKQVTMEESKLHNILDPLVQVKQGKVRGKVSDDRRGKQYYSFLGIPYAKPPIGDLRFKAPVPADPWPETFDATRDGNISIQENLYKEIEGSEDCLNLNVYTPCLPRPDLNENILKPVMVFIHGGLFLSGSNRKEMLGPEVLITEDVVIVTINYRLGILGFLSLQDPSLDVPGNAGFKDMVLALKWVQTNIHNFMGNPNNVTIFGNSSGAVSVHLLTLSPMGQGLFHKAICQSGSALSGWGHGYDSSNSIAKAFRLGNVNDKELFKCLKNASAKEILNVQDQIDKETIITNKPRPVGVVVEPSSSNGESFFSEHPIKILSSGRYNKVPLLMGYNTGDGMIVETLVGPKNTHLYWTDEENNVPGLFYLEKGSLISKQLGEEITKFYFGTGTKSRETHLEQFYEITLDNAFLKGILTSIQYQLQMSDTPIYMYRLSLESELCFFKNILNVKIPGVCHVDELGYLFTNMLTKPPAPGSIADIAQKRMCRLWANFAKYGNPTPSLDPLLSIIWKPVTDPSEIDFLDICEDLSMDKNPKPERMKFWNKIYAEGYLTARL